MLCKGRPNNEIVKIVFNYLKHSQRLIEVDEGSYRLIQGNPNINTISRAFQDGAIRIEEDGTIYLCGEYIHPKWDTVRIRRKVEDYLRKSASTSEIIQIADYLGVSITS